MKTASAQTAQITKLDRALKALFSNDADAFRYQNGHCAEMAFAIVQAVGGQAQIIYRYPSESDPEDEGADECLISHVVAKIGDTEFDYTGKDAYQRWIDGFWELHPNSDWDVVDVSSPKDMQEIANGRTSCDPQEIDRLAKMIRNALHQK